MENIDTTKLTFIGSMNYLLQAFKDEENPDICYVDQYQPRKNKIWSGELDTERVKKDFAETIERMKIAQKLMQDFIDGKTNKVYYWDLENESEIYKQNEL